MCFSNNSQTTLYSEFHCHSHELLLWKKKQKKTPSNGSLWMGVSPGLSRQPSRCWGSAWNETLLGHCKRTVKNLIMALMPYCLWRHKAMFLNSNITSTRYSIVSLVFSYGVWKRTGTYVDHIWSVNKINEMKQWSMKYSMVPSRDCTPQQTSFAFLLGLWVMV